MPPRDFIGSWSSVIERVIELNEDAIDLQFIDLKSKDDIRMQDYDCTYNSDQAVGSLIQCFLKEKEAELSLSASEAAGAKKKPGPKPKKNAAAEPASSDSVNQQAFDAFVKKLHLNEVGFLNSSSKSTGVILREPPLGVSWIGRGLQ